MIVLMTDGHDNENADPGAAAAIAKAAGITVYVVAVDVGGVAYPRDYSSGCYFSDFLPSCIDEPTMLEAAGDISRLFVVNTFAGLADDVATGVINSIEVPCATRASLALGLDVEPVAVPTASSGEVNVTGTTVTWALDSVGESESLIIAVDYCQCEHRETAVDFLTSATYADDETNDPSLSDLLDLTAQMTELCPTPAPTPPPSPSPTPQPTAIAPDTLFVGVMDTADGAWEAVYSPDGTHVYLTGKDSDSVVAFEVEPSDGGLTMVGEADLTNGEEPGAGTLDGPTALAASPDGRCLFVVSAGSGSLTSLRVDGGSGGEGGSGNLTYAGTVSDVAFADAVDVVVSPPSGHHVYVSSPACGCIMAFAANAETCGLTYLSSVTESLVSPAGMSMSPDGLSLYGTDSEASGGAIMLFSRNPNSGELALRQTIVDGEGPLM